MIIKGSVYLEHFEHIAIMSVEADRDLCVIQLICDTFENRYWNAPWLRCTYVDASP